MLASGMGTATNLLSTDVHKVFELQLFLHYIVIGPVYILALVLQLVLEVGWPALAGFGLLVCCLPLQAWLAERAAQAKGEALVQTDGRTNLLAELLHGMLTVKLQVQNIALGRARHHAGCERDSVGFGIEGGTERTGADGRRTGERSRRDGGHR